MTKLSLCFLTLTFISSGLIGCSSKPAPEPKVTEIVPKKDKGVASLDTPEAKLFSDASQYYSDRLYTIARDNFESLQTAYPLSPYAAFAELKIADCDFELRDFDKAAIGYEEFLKNHPISESAPYATLMAGRSFQLSSNGPGRDSASLRKSLDYLSKVINHYADSAYVQTAHNYRQKAQKELAEHEELILNFYRKKGNSKAYEVRKAEYDRIWAQILKAESDVAPELAQAESLDQIPVIDPGQLALLTHSQTAAATASATFKSTAAPASPNPPQLKTLISRIECKQDPIKEMMIYLNSPLASDSGLTDGDSFSTTGGRVQIELPFKDIKPVATDCFGDKDVTIDRDGKLSINAVKSVQLMTLTNPDRLLFIAN